MRKKLVALIIIFLLIVILPSCQDEAKNEVQILEKPDYKYATVHDPSIIKANDTYYIIGSHMMFAKSNDLIQWEQISTDVKTNSLMPDIYEQLSDSFDYAKTDTLWAGDIVQLNDGKFYMYYCLCEGSSPLSVLGVAVAEDIEGPYKDMGVFLRSGSIKEDGKYHDATTEPNVIDPHVFYDNDGKLWMVYGSYSGGIFILEMDENTAMPIDGQGYGTKLSGGNHTRMEGAYIQYNKDTNYYYMFISFGGLTADGGYHIRVSRSEKPNGPYLDIKGQNMLDAVGADGTFFDDKAIESYGAKLIGNFTWDDDKNSVNGYVSPGHNSTYWDEETNRYFIIFHTRFPNLDEYHSVRVHQMFFNEEGWPVIAPLSYAGEKISEYGENQVLGEYKVINFGKNISDEIVTPNYISLKEKGTVSGDLTGVWEIIGDTYANLTLDDVKYKGTFISQWDTYQNAQTMAFSGLSDEGVTIFMVKISED